MPVIYYFCLVIVTVATFGVFYRKYKASATISCSFTGAILFAGFLLINLSFPAKTITGPKLHTSIDDWYFRHGTFTMTPDSSAVVLCNGSDIFVIPDSMIVWETPRQSLIGKPIRFLRDNQNDQRKILIDRDPFSDIALK